MDWERSKKVLVKRQGMMPGVSSASLVSLALLVGVLWFLGNPEQVYACKCAQPGTPSEELEKFPAVFAGRVVSVSHSYDPDAASVSTEDRTTVGFEVSAVWKGTVHEDMYVTTPPTGGSCGVAFIEGEEYIVYGYDSNYDDGGYTVGICSRTDLLGQAQADLDAFEKGHAPSSRDGRTSARTATGHGYWLGLANHSGRCCCGHFSRRDRGVCTRGAKVGRASRSRSPGFFSLS